MDPSTFVTASKPPDLPRPRLDWRIEVVFTGLFLTVPALFLFYLAGVFEGAADWRERLLKLGLPLALGLMVLAVAALLGLVLHRALGLIPLRKGWLSGKDLERSFGCAFGVALLLGLSNWYTDPDSPLGPSILQVIRFFLYVLIFSSVLFSFSGLRHEKNIRQIMCGLLFWAWIVLFLMILRIAWH
jgi:hypothetical protein